LPDARRKEPLQLLGPAFRESDALGFTGLGARSSFSRSGFGCNHNEQLKAWVVANAEIDFAAYVAEVLDDLGLEPIPQPDDA
jgi:hypothetical protein